MSEWFETLEGLQGQVWQSLSRGVADKRHPARLPNFATVSATGWPEVRTVVLRAARPSLAQVEVHTDLHSDKIASLRATPRAALHVWEPKRDLQIRLQTTVTILSGDDVTARWKEVPDPARQSYGVTPPPGTPIATALDYVKDPDPATFAVLICDVQQIDAVHLGDRHRRAVFARDRDWAGQWLSP